MRPREGMAKLEAVFAKENGTVTAGNASGINDAAAAVVLMEKSVAANKGLKPMARLVSYGHAGVDPKVMGLGPVGAVKRALGKAGLKLDQIDVIESNEAFAAQALGVSKELGMNAARVNPERRRDRARASDRRDRMHPHHQGDVRIAANRRALRPDHDVHRWRPGHRGGHRAHVASCSADALQALAARQASSKPISFRKALRSCVPRWPATSRTNSCRLVAFCAARLATTLAIGPR